MRVPPPQLQRPPKDVWPSPRRPEFVPVAGMVVPTTTQRRLAIACLRSSVSCILSALKLAVVLRE
jgi:hypothetical protein